MGFIKPLTRVGAPPIFGVSLEAKGLLIDSKSTWLSVENYDAFTVRGKTSEMRLWSQDILIWLGCVAKPPTRCNFPAKGKGDSIESGQGVPNTYLYTRWRYPRLFGGPMAYINTNGTSGNMLRCSYVVHFIPIIFGTLSGHQQQAAKSP